MDKLHTEAVIGLQKGTQTMYKAYIDETKDPSPKNLLHWERRIRRELREERKILLENRDVQRPLVIDTLDESMKVLIMKKKLLYSNNDDLKREVAEIKNTMNVKRRKSKLPVPVDQDKVNRKITIIAEKGISKIPIFVTKSAKKSKDLKTPKQRTSKIPKLIKQKQMIFQNSSTGIHKRTHIIKHQGSRIPIPSGKKSPAIRNSS